MIDPALWQRVHAHLDAGRDPFEDPTVQAALLADPVALEEIASMRAVLTWAGAGAAPRVVRRPGGWRRRAAAAALVLVIAGAGIAAAVIAVSSAASGEGGAGDGESRWAQPFALPMPRFATTGAVRSAVAELFEQTGDAIVWERCAEGVVARQRSIAVVTLAGEPLSPGRSASVVALATFENQLR